MWHLAAIYDLAVKEEIAWKVNVEGTKMVCNFVRAHPAIERFIILQYSLCRRDSGRKNT